MSDWYDNGRLRILEEINEVFDVTEPEKIAEKVYSFLSEIGLIDYDIEKEIIWERYNSDEED